MSADDWRKWINKDPFPYKGLNDPKYISDRDKLFTEGGNGWWVNDGRGWTMYWESSMEYHRRKRKERGLK